MSALLAANIQADLLILMSDVDGIYNKPPWEDGARLMHTYTSQDRNSIEFGKKSKVCLFVQIVGHDINATDVVSFFFCRLEQVVWIRRSAPQHGHWIAASAL